MLVEYRKSIDELNAQKQTHLERIEDLKKKINFEKKLRDKLKLQSQKFLNSTERGLDYKAKIKRESSRNK